MTLPRPPRRMPRASDVCRPGSATSAFLGANEGEGTESRNVRTVAAGDAEAGIGPRSAPLGPLASVASASVSSRSREKPADDGTTTGRMPRRLAPSFEKDDEPTDMIARRPWQPPPVPKVASRRRAAWVLPVGVASLLAAILVLVALVVR